MFWLLRLLLGSRYVPDATLPNSGYYTSAKSAIDSLNTYATKVQRSVPAEVAAKPEVDTMNINIKNFVTASKEVPITVCPTSCLNVGSFYGGSKCGWCQRWTLLDYTDGRLEVAHSVMLSILL